MSDDKLYNGIALIIDDAIDTEYEKEDKIGEIVKRIDGEGIPCCKYRTLPDDSIINNLRSVNFILLDWWLLPSNIPPNTPEKDIPSTVREEIVSNNLEFLKKIKSKCFTPVFIFTNHAKEDVTTKLKQVPSLYNDTDESRNFILIRKKQDLIGNDNLFNEIENWINNNPAIYTLKKWEAAFYEAKNSSFWHLFNRSPVWPKILWKTFSDDFIDKDSNMVDTLYRLIKARISLVEFDKSLICAGDDSSLNMSEIKEVMQCIMYLDKKRIPENDLQPGDIFKFGGAYYLNIRSACDTVIGRDEFDGEFYAIKGTKMSKKQIDNRIEKGIKIIVPHVNETILYGLDNKDFVAFSFVRVYQYVWEEKRDKRIARLLPPHINDVQQRYAHYVSRVGLPRLPAEIIKAAVT